MAIDLHTEHLLSFKQATKHPAMRTRTGDAPHLSKIHRLHLYGIRGRDGRVKLEVMKLPSGYVTSLEAIQRFIDTLTYGSDVPPPARRSYRVAHQDLADAEAELRAARI